MELRQNGHASTTQRVVITVDGKYIFRHLQGGLVLAFKFGNMHHIIMKLHILYDTVWIVFQFIS